MAEINSLTSKTTFTDTDSIPIEEAGGTVKRYLLSVFRKIIPATNSAVAFQVMKADGVTTAFNVDTTNNRIGINTNAPAAKVHTISEDGSNSILAQHSASSNIGAVIVGAKSRGTSAVPSAIQTDDVIIDVRAYGYGTTSYAYQGFLRFLATENWTDTARGTKFNLYTTPTGGTATVLSIAVNAAGAVIALPTYSVTVGGTNRVLYIDSTGLIGYVSSIRESKTEIESLGDTEWLFDLTPRKFYYRKKDEQGNYTDEKDGDLQYGLVYDEVEKVNPDLCFFDLDENGAKIPRGVNYSKLVPALLDQLQKQKARIAALEARLSKAGI